MNPHIFFEIILIIALCVSIAYKPKQKAQKPIWPDVLELFGRIDQAQTIGDLEDIHPLMDRFEILYGTRPIFPEVMKDVVNKYNERAEKLKQIDLSSEGLEIPTLFLYEKREN